VSRRPVAAALVSCLGLVVVTSAATRPDTVVQVRVLRFVDRSRAAHFSDGTSGPRVLGTEVRFPAAGGRSLPLVMFAHGFGLTPDTYARLLDAWARAGYVVAAPVFPVESTNARGGPSQRDLVNEPRDLTFVLSRLIARNSPVRKLIDSHHVAFAGQSDGAVAAFAASYERGYRDPRVDAALIMSGAPLGAFAATMPGAPPLLAVQGTADPFNAPTTTASYFRRMRRPKFLLWLLGASHKPPYTTDARYLGVVERTTIAFLDHYLRGARLRPLIAGGARVGVSRLVAEP
jgi:pimeloyl-ACP methyl ester carboxylesterase